VNRSLKLGLDFLFGLIIPIIILSRFSDSLGNITAYVVSALIPVAWVAIDLLFITKRFNFITTFLGLNAVVRGILAFWFVDGVAYAFKDSVASLLWVVIFGASLAFGRPLIGAFITQAFDPRTPRQESSLKNLFDEFPVRRAMWMGTAAITIVSVITTVANFFLNLWIVVAEFGTEAFNLQVARANAIARFAIAIPEALVLVVVMGLVLKIVYDRLPKTEEDTDFWDLMEMREAEMAEPGKAETEKAESGKAEAGRAESGKYEKDEKNE
jgi:hypothetical protein